MTFLGIVVSVSSALASSMIENCIESSLKTLMVRVGIILQNQSKFPLTEILAKSLNF